MTSQLRLTPALLGLFATVAIALPVRADAPDKQYAPFDESSSVIRDLKTGLAWTRSVSANPVSFSIAQTSCIGGRRLPTLKELLTLVDEEPHQKYDENVGQNVTRMIDANAFDQSTPVDRAYWTSSLGTDGGVWTVDFKTGLTTRANAADGRYVRCVAFTP